MNSSTTAYICPVCCVDKGTDLYKHVFNAHGYDKQEIEKMKKERRQAQVLAAAKPIHTCDDCAAIFTNIRAMRAHQRAKHAEDYFLRTITCPLCSAEVNNHRELATHARLSHAEEDNDYAVENITFDSFQEFKEWKALSEEAKVISRVVSKTGEISGNAKVTRLRCHRALNTPKTIPAKTKKVVAYCTAYMKITEDGGKVHVEHCFTHCGHEAQPAMLRLDANSQNYIISLLTEGLTIRQVHKKLREKVREGPKNRLYFTTPRDIRNIASKCRVQPGRFHNLDTTSVQMRVDRNCESDGIQFYQPAQNANGDGFQLVIITPTQKDWLRKYGRRAVCVDDTFSLTSYSLRLATIVVADEWDRALPAAYLLSYRMTEVEIGIMFEQIKKHLPSFHTDFFMTDDTNTFWNGFARVFPTAWTKRLLCLWHVKQAMKRNAHSKLMNNDLLEPYMHKIREICLIRDRAVFVNKYSSLLKHLRDQGEERLAAYMENSWSDRVEQWAAFGRLHSCVSTSMLCERFHKKLKHEILEGKANVRMDSLIQLLIGLTVEAEEEREIMKERGVEEGRYRLQQHHKNHKAALDKYSNKQECVVVKEPGQWQINENDKLYEIQEHYCPCDQERNNHCQRGCGACPYAFACNCSMDTKSGISCMHVHAALMFASDGRRTFEVSEELVEAATEDQLYIVPEDEFTSSSSSSEDEEEEMQLVTVEDDEEDEREPEQLRRRSTDNRDSYRDLMQRIEMEYAVGRTRMLGGLRNATDDALEKLTEALRCMEAFNRLTASLDSEANKENSITRLARRPDVPRVGRPQGLTPIRKLHKRAQLRKEDEAKRRPTLTFPDYDETDTCAVCLRTQPLEGEGNVFWIQCPACEDWLHKDCVERKCPKDGTILDD